LGSLDQLRIENHSPMGIEYILVAEVTIGVMDEVGGFR
jgi:hypothetical protein